MTLDYAGRRVIFEQGELGEPNGTDILPIQIQNGMPHLQARLGQRNVLLRMDSGSGYAFTFNPGAEGLLYKQDPVAGPLSLSLTGLVRVKLARLQSSIDVGSHRFAEPAITLTSGAAKIGGRGLMPFKVTFDQKHERVRLSRESHDAIKTSHRWTAGGLGVQKTMSGQWVVVDVIPGSSAESAGVHRQDIIKSVDSHPVENLDYDRFGDFSADQKGLALELIRGGKSLRLTLPVPDPVP